MGMCNLEAVGTGHAAAAAAAGWVADITEIILNLPYLMLLSVP